MLGDITVPKGTNGALTNVTLNSIGSLMDMTFVINDRYQPWANANNPKGFGVDKTNGLNIAVKDINITGSDSWQFPTNKFPNIGWIGRVHRGTPWQTVFLKSTNSSKTTVNGFTNFHDINNWQGWTGNRGSNVLQIIPFTNSDGYITTNYSDPRDCFVTMPANDYALLDLFTTAPNDAASRGQLSVNQTNTAAWAAILDSVCVLSNNTAYGFISPYDQATNGQLMIPFLVEKINQYRSQIITNQQNGQTNAFFPGQVFTTVGQVLGVPELTVNSPYIPGASAQLRDEVIERIPQQILSLLRVGTPKYVIFAYGQSLKPADRSLVTSGPFFGMCTNYQITGEIASRMVVRFEGLQAPGTTMAPGYPPPQPHAVVETYNVIGPEQ
jgi:hypothetical protein